MRRTIILFLFLCMFTLIALGALVRAQEEVYLPIVAKGGLTSTVPATLTPTATATQTPTATPTPTSISNWPDVQLSEVASGFDRPVHVTNAGDGSGRLFVVERTGYIHIVQDGKRLDAPFLDIHEAVYCCESETGLLSVAFPANFASNGRFYVTYTVQQNGQLRSRIARFQVGNDPDQVDVDSEQIVLMVDQPYANHNGGQIVFGPDGYLYIGMGDGGSGGDPHNHGQRPETLLGSMLRIDVESEPSGTYTIPASNPFVGHTSARAETWAYGLRNPWRFSFDRQTGDLWIADVGQGAREEVNVQPASSSGGENYGWNIMEGTLCYNATTCDKNGLTLPVWDYGRSEGRSVTGGFVYRGSAFPALQGTYVYGDYITGRLWGLRRMGEEWQNHLFLSTGKNISSFGEDENGELYLVDYGNGRIYQVELSKR